MNGRDYLDDLDAQIRDHLALETEENVARGMSREEARAVAHRKFGNVARVKEDSRAVWIPTWLDQLRQDAGYGFRSFRRQPGFYAVAILTIALGIGATTLLFGVAYGVLLKPLPWADADRLVRVTELRQGRTGRVSGTVSNATYLAWADHAATIEGLGGWLTQTVTLSGAGDPVRLSLIPTTPSLFEILKASPFIGRRFAEGEGGPNQPGVVILSFGLWQEQFGGRSDILGEVAHLDDKPYTVIGVMPREFAFPDRGARAWTAWAVPPAVAANGNQTGVIFRAIARLRAGVSPEQASAEATSRARSAPDIGLVARALFGAAGPIDVSAVAEIQAVTADVRPGVLALLAAAILLLVTAIANVTNLQLARATTRRREMVVRAAIGAGPGRIIRQLLVENSLIGIGGGAAGLTLAIGLQRWLPTLLPTDFPRLDRVTIDANVSAFAVALSLIASVGCGLLPAWRARCPTLVRALSDDGFTGEHRTTHSRLAPARGFIMIGQVAIACVLLIGAGLLMRSFVSLMRADRGYDPVNVLTARLPLPPSYPAERRGELLQILVERAQAVPGVTHAAYSSGLPLVSAGGSRAFNMRSPHDPAVEIEVQATQHAVSVDYFAVMRLRLVEGRLFSDADTPQASPAIVVNRTFARRYLNAQAVGVHIPQRGPGAGGVRFTNEISDAEVIGVVEDMRQNTLDSTPQPEMFVSFHQVVPSSLRGFDPILIARTTADPTGYAPTFRDLLRQQAPTLAFDSVMTMEDLVATSLAKPKLYALVLGGLAGFALLIAGVGLFGVLSFAVAQRTREIGVRAALGAQVRDVVLLVLRQALSIVAVGLAIGLAVAAAGAKLVSAILYDVTAHDTVAFAAAPLVVLLAAVAACALPAHRAARASPLASLRA